MQMYPTKILIVEDNPDHAQLAKAYLAGPKSSLMIASSKEECKRILEQHTCDIILLDYHLPDADGLAILKELKAFNLTDAPVVLVTGHGHEEVAVEAMKAGAADYVIKSGDYPKVLPEVVARVIDKARILAEKKRFEQEILLRNKELQVLNAVSVALNKSLVLTEILDGAAKGLVKHLSLDTVAVWLLDATTCRLELKYSCASRGGRAGTGRLPFQAGQLEEILAFVDQPVVENDLAADGGRLSQPLSGSGLSSVAIVPLNHHSKRLGYFLAASSQPDYFADRRMKLLESIVNQISAAVENIKLYEDTSRLNGKLENVLNSSLDMILTLDRQGRILFHNRHFAVAMFNGEPAEGQEFIDFIAEESKPAVRRKLKESLSEAPPVYQAEMRAPDGTVNSCLISQCAIRGENELLLVIKDTSEIVRLQSQLAQAEKLSALGHMIAGAAHELNNPLGGILGYTQLLAEEDLPANVQKDISVIQKETRRCQGIVKKLLAFARKQSTGQELVDLNEIVATVVQVHAHQLNAGGVEVSVDTDPAIPQVVGNYDQLQQVVVQLLSNATDALRMASSKQVAIRTSSSGDIVHLEVSDTGAGIASQDINRVFDPFFTTKEVGQGMGLGLSMCFGIVKSHQGKLTVESVPGRGTSVRVELPAARPDEHVPVAEMDIAHS